MAARRCLTPIPEAVTRLKGRRPGLVVLLLYVLLIVVSIPVAAAGPLLQCAVQNSEAAVPATEDGACACVDGWVGPECRVSMLLVPLPPSLPPSFPPSLSSSPGPIGSYAAHLRLLPP